VVMAMPDAGGWRGGAASLWPSAADRCPPEKIRSSSTRLSPLNGSGLNQKEKFIDLYVNEDMNATIR